MKSGEGILFLFDGFDELFGGFFDFLLGLTEVLAKLGQHLGAKKNEDDDGDDEDFGKTDIL